MRASLSVLAASFILAGLPAAGAEEKLGRLIVKVIEAGTGKPVAGARIYPQTGSLDDGEHKTDASGRVEIPVPLGNLRIGEPLAPQGYWIVKKSGPVPAEQVALTRQQPTVERTFEAHPGVLWPAKVITLSRKPLEGVSLLVSHNSFPGPTFGAGVTDAGGNARVTLPREGGSLWISCSHKLPIDFTTSRVQLEVPPDFDHTQVVSVKPAAMGDRMVLVDRQGHQASCAGCTAALQGSVAHLVFEVNDPPGNEFAGEVTGTIVDQTGRPIQAATVVCSSAAITAEECEKQTNERGEFRFRSLFKWAPPGSLPTFDLFVTKDGFGWREVGHLFSPGTDGVFRLEPFVLKPAYSAKVRVLDVEGQPVEGAWLQSEGGDLFGHRSDREGYCTVRNLPLGSVAVWASFGAQAGSAKIEVTPASADAEPLVIKLQRKQVAQPWVQAPRRQPVRLELGQLAPPWSIERWSDGKEHTLAELRGRIVVIEFLDVSSPSCSEITLPVSHSLQKRFPDVTFIHIHASGEREHYVKELLELNKWNFVVGFDKGKDEDGLTQQRYGCTDDGATVILDRDGKVLMNTELRGNLAAEQAKAKAIAAAAGLPWPIDKDASEEELMRRNRRYYEHWIGSEIEKALEK